MSRWGWFLGYVMFGMLLMLAAGFTMMIVSLNGCAVTVRFEQGNDDKVEATFLAEHTEVPGVVMPINIMVTDQTGEAVRIKIDQDGTTFH